MAKEHTNGRNVRARQRGFTMIEILIVVSVIVIIATIAVPNYLSSKVVANEAAVVATLRKVSTAEELFRNGRYVDQDGNSWGEFGYLGELSGITALRSNGNYLKPAVLSPSFGFIDAEGFGMRHGYTFRLYLPNAAGLGVPEKPSTIGTVDPANAAQYFSCIAWPRVYGKSGYHTYFINQQGEIVKTIDTHYSGTTGAPIANCALIGVPVGVIAGNSLATGGTIGVDGNRWISVQ
jgi:prepilin-type N-terminal cleavage/methylation domain-containing protein